MHLHHFVDGVCADSRAVGGPCGEPQTYRPPTGKGYEFTDVLVDAADLRMLLDFIEPQRISAYGLSEEEELSYQRVRQLLD